MNGHRCGGTLLLLTSILLESGIKLGGEASLGAIVLMLLGVAAASGARY